MQERALERVVLPLSGLSSWLVVLAGGLMMLHVLGINVQPLLTVTRRLGYHRGSVGPDAGGQHDLRHQPGAPALRHMGGPMWRRAAQPACTALLGPLACRSACVRARLPSLPALLCKQAQLGHQRAHTMCAQFLSRPFVVGDRIDVTTAGGGRLLTGYVERVDPMRTILRSDAGLPFMLPNKVPVTALPVLPC